MGLNLQYSYGQTPLDIDESEGLKIKSISTQKDLNEFEQLNIEKAIEWTMSAKIKPDVLLTEKFIKQLHTKMYGEVWQWAGKYRKTDKNIGLHWPQIAIEMKKLMDDATYWVNHHSFTPEEIAIKFKHRLVFIHCFPNGNGRHSRLMADLILQVIFGKEPFNGRAVKTRTIRILVKNISQHYAKRTRVI
jgi:Fic-DOC domain mobile mystery protein B